MSESPAEINPLRGVHPGAAWGTTELPLVPDATGDEHEQRKQLQASEYLRDAQENATDQQVELITKQLPIGSILNQYAQVIEPTAHVSLQIHAAIHEYREATRQNPVDSRGILGAAATLLEPEPVPNPLLHADDPLAAWEDAGLPLGPSAETPRELRAQKLASTYLKEGALFAEDGQLAEIAHAIRPVLGLYAQSFSQEASPTPLQEAALRQYDEASLADAIAAVENTHARPQYRAIIGAMAIVMDPESQKPALPE